MIATRGVNFLLLRAGSSQQQQQQQQQPQDIHLDISISININISITLDIWYRGNLQDSMYLIICIPGTDDVPARPGSAKLRWTTARA